MPDWILRPWPWYVAGPLLGLVVPMLLLAGGRQFGISANFRHLCAATLPTRLEFFQYDWKREGAWNLLFAVGIIAGGYLASHWLSGPTLSVAIADAARADLARLGITDFSGLVPPEFMSWSALATVPGFVILVVGGFLVGFGARYAGGCTSGHAIFGLASLQWPSFVAVGGFFAGGLLMVHVLMPWLLG